MLDDEAEHTLTGYRRSYSVDPKGLSVVVLEKQCFVTKKPYKLTVGLERYEEWLKSGATDKVFPDLDTDQKRFLARGLTPDEK